MNTRRIDTRMMEEGRVDAEVRPYGKQVQQVPHDGQGFQVSQGSQVPPQGDHTLYVVGGNDVPELTNWDIREFLLAFPQAATSQSNLKMVPRINAIESTMSYRLRDFVRLNPLIFLVSKAE